MICIWYWHVTFSLVIKCFNSLILLWSLKGFWRYILVQKTWTKTYGCTTILLSRKQRICGSIVSHSGTASDPFHFFILYIYILVGTFCPLWDLEPRTSHKPLPFGPSINCVITLLHQSLKFNLLSCYSLNGDVFYLNNVEWLLLLATLYC